MAKEKKKKKEEKKIPLWVRMLGIGPTLNKRRLTINEVIENSRKKR